MNIREQIAANIEGLGYDKYGCADQILTLFQNWLEKELDGLERLSAEQIIEELFIKSERSKFSDIHLEGEWIAQAQPDAVREHFSD